MFRRFGDERVDLLEIRDRRGASCSAKVRPAYRAPSHAGRLAFTERAQHVLKFCFPHFHGYSIAPRLARAMRVRWRVPEAPVSDAPVIRCAAHRRWLAKRALQCRHFNRCDRASHPLFASLRSTVQRFLNELVVNTPKVIGTPVAAAASVMTMRARRGDVFEMSRRPADQAAKADDGCERAAARRFLAANGISTRGHFDHAHIAVRTPADFTVRARPPAADR